MRDQGSLAGAFALLERAADGYAAAAEEVIAAEPDAVVHELIEPRPAAAPLRRRFKRPTVAFGAVLVIAAVALGIAHLTGVATHADPAVGPTGGERPGPARSLPFALSHRSDAHIVAVVAMDPADTTVTLVSGWNEWQLNLYGPGSDFAPRFAAGVRSVTVNGRAGYYGASSLIRAEVVSSPTTPPESVSTGTTPSRTQATERQSVAWRYEPSGWALLQPQGPSFATITTTLALARSLHFDATTAMRSAFSLRHSPAGMRLLEWSSTYKASANPIPGSGGWDTEATYGPRGPANEIDIRVESSAATPAPHPVPVTVDGHRGQWDAASRTISVQLSAHVYLTIGAEAAKYGGPLTLTKSQLLAVANNVTVTTSPSRPTHWFDAKTALP